LAVYDSDRRRHDTELFQFGEGGLVRCDVAICKFHFVLAKELLRPVAEQSARLRVEDDGVRHGHNPIAVLSFSVITAMGGTPPL
jgi:hypothetical protein